MAQGKYEVGRAYYEMGVASEWGIDSPEVVIDTWFYQGFFKLDWNTSDCDPPNHFHVFQPFVAQENTLGRSPEQGLKIPSIPGRELAMLTFDELIRELAQIKGTSPLGSPSSASPAARGLG